MDEPYLQEPGNIPGLLTPKQKNFQTITTANLLQYAETDTEFLKSIITSNKSNIYGYDPESNVQSSVWKLLLPKTK